MNDPLLDPRDQDLETELLRAGRDVKLSPAAEARILTSLGIAAGGLVAGKAAAGVGGTFAKLSTLVSGKASLVAAGVVSMGVIGGGAWYASSVSSEPVAPRVVEAPIKVVDQAEPRAADTRQVEKTNTSNEVEPPAEQAPAKSRSKAPPAPERAERGATLGDEVAMVESASRALRSGNPQAALGRLAEYRQRFPRGKLALEAQVLRIEALAQAGRGADAARLARGFLKRHPHSPVAARIRRYAE